MNFYYQVIFPFLNIRVCEHHSLKYEGHQKSIMTEVYITCMSMEE